MFLLAALLVICNQYVVPLPSQLHSLITHDKFHEFNKKTRLISIESQPKKIVVVVVIGGVVVVVVVHEVVVVIPAVDTRNIPLNFG